MTGQTSDSVKVHIDNIKAANLLFDDLSECEESNDSLRSAVFSAQVALDSKGGEIRVLKEQVGFLGQLSDNKDKIITSLEKSLRKEKRKKVGLFIVAMGLMVFGIFK